MTQFVGIMSYFWNRIYLIGPVDGQKSLKNEKKVGYADDFLFGLQTDELVIRKKTRFPGKKKKNC